jgi:hypothetical protein
MGFLGLCNLSLYFQLGIICRIKYNVLGSDYMVLPFVHLEISVEDQGIQDK